MKLPNYLYIEPQAGMSGAGIIVSTRPPFMFANVWKYKSGEEDRMASLLSKNEANTAFRIDGYRIVLTFAGCWLNGQVLSRVSQSEQLQEMGNFYYSEKLEGKEKLKFLYGNRS